MSCNDDYLPIPARKQPCLLFSSRCAGSSTRRTRHPKIYSSTSPSPDSSLSRINLDNLLDPLDDITLDSDLDQRSASSTTLLSVSPSTSTSLLLTNGTCASSESELLAQPFASRPLYPLREPGQMTAQRIQRLRARTAAVITSLPATSENVAGEDEVELPEAIEVLPMTQGPKLKRVSGIRDLRRAFHDGEHGLVHFASNSSLENSKTYSELGFLANPTSQPHLSLRSSSRTLVGSRPQSAQSASDLKTLCGSTFSSLSLASLFATKVYPTLPSSRPSHARTPSDTSQSILSRKRVAHSLLTPLSRRHASLQLDTPPSRPSGADLWSCAKISQSALKRASRRGHAPRRVFSNPIAISAF